MAVQKPLLVCTCFPGEGHFYPVLALTTHLMKHGYSAVFIADETLKDKVQAAGVEFLPAAPVFTPERMERLIEISQMPAGIEKFGKQVSTVFFSSLKERVDKFHEQLEEIKSRNPSRGIVIVEDIFNAVSVPYKLGKPLPKGFDSPPKNVGLGCAPLMLESEDLGPMMMKLPPDSTLSGKLRNKALYGLVRSSTHKALYDGAKEGFASVGCTDVEELRLWNTFVENYNVVFQLCSPSLEYDISDMPKSVRFTGVLPRRETPANYEYPEWWEEITSEKGDRKVLFASQGTVSVDYNEVITPAIEAFGGREDVILVVALGIKDAKLDLDVPSNVKVVDYFPYDTILNVADVFITNGGYGAFTHGVRNGCPMVIAGDSEEKAEVAVRAAYTGIGVNLAVQRATPSQLTDGVQQVLNDSRFRDRAVELKKENEEMDSLEIMRRGVDALLA